MDLNAGEKLLVLVTKRHRKFHLYAQLSYTKISYLCNNTHLQKDAAFLHFCFKKSSENAIFPWNGNIRKLMKIWYFFTFSQIFVRRKFLFSCSAPHYPSHLSQLATSLLSNISDLAASLSSHLSHLPSLLPSHFCHFPTSLPFHFSHLPSTLLSTLFPLPCLLLSHLSQLSNFPATKRSLWNNVFPLGRQSKHVWLIIRQLPM